MDVLARILLRYGTGALLTWGLLDADLAKLINGDEDILLYAQIALSAAAAGVVEGWYWLAKRMGWRT